MSERPPISPRSPRAALEPEQVPPPPKRSERARNPFVVIGNAIITILIILMVGAGTAYYYGRQLLETPGPLKEDKVVNIPARAGKRDIADALQREGVINVNPWLFIGSVFALKASSDLKPGEYEFRKSASLRDVIATIVEGKVVQHAVTIPELGTITAVHPPIVVLTSNRTRDLHDALKRRCLYHWIDYPPLERAVAIIRSRVPQASGFLAEQVARAVTRLRSLDVQKPPGIAESIGWVGALEVLGLRSLADEGADETLGSVLKYREDVDLARSRGMAWIAGESA